MTTMIDWQTNMVAALDVARERLRLIQLSEEQPLSASDTDWWDMQTGHAQVAQAASLTALAYAVAIAGRHIEVALGGVSDAIRDHLDR